MVGWMQFDILQCLIFQLMFIYLEYVLIYNSVDI